MPAAVMHSASSRCTTAGAVFGLCHPRSDDVAHAPSPRAMATSRTDHLGTADPVRAMVTSDVNGLTQGPQRRLQRGLGQGGMGVDGVDDLLKGRL